jgi:hypothetical protein
MAKRKAPPADRDVMTDEEKRLREFTSEFLADYRADEPFRKGMREDNDFYDGNQLSQEERDILEERGQPPVTINRIKPKMDAIFGMQQAMLVDTKAYPKGNREEEAEAVSEFFRQIEDENDFDDTESLAFEDICIAGRAAYEVGKEWDGLTYKHCIKRCHLEDIVPDRHARSIDDPDSCRLSISFWADLKRMQAMFPEAADRLANSANDKALNLWADPDNRRIRPDQYNAQGPAVTRDDLGQMADIKSQRVRLVKTWYRTFTPKRYFFHAELDNGKPVDVTDASQTELNTLRAAKPDGEIIVQEEKKLHCLTFTWNAQLEWIQDTRPYDPEAKFPIILMEGFRERNTSVNYGLVRQMKDPQREVNKRRSKYLHLISVNRTIYEKGVFVNEQTAIEEIQKPDGRIALVPGSLQKFQVQNNLDMGQSHFLLLQQATQEIDAAGVPREMEGRSNSSSGREFQLRQQQATQGIRKLVSNLRWGRRRVGLYLLDEWIHENPNAGLTPLDVLVEEAPDTLTLQQETFDKLVALAEKGIVPPDFIDLLIEVSSLDPDMKKRFLERIQQRQAAQAQMLAMQAGAGGGAVPGGGGVQ